VQVGEEFHIRMIFAPASLEAIAYEDALRAFEMLLVEFATTSVEKNMLH